MSSASFLNLAKSKSAALSFASQPVHHEDVEGPTSSPSSSSSVSTALGALKHCCSSLMSGYGICVVIVIGLLKLGALAIIVNGVSNGLMGDDDSISYSASISNLKNSKEFQQFTANRPLRLRKLINDASSKAAAEGALVTLQTTHELLYDTHHIEVNNLIVVLRTKKFVVGAGIYFLQLNMCVCGVE